MIDIVQGRVFGAGPVCGDVVGLSQRGGDRSRSSWKRQYRATSPPKQRATAPADWLDHALAYATTRLRGATATLCRDDLGAIAAVVALARRARRLVITNLVIAGTFITVLALWDLIGTLPLPLGVAGHEGSTVIVGLNGLRLLRESAWRPSR